MMNNKENTTNKFPRLHGDYDPVFWRFFIYFNRTNENPIFYNYIKDNLENIQTEFLEQSKRFIFLPNVAEIKSLKDFYLYCFPVISSFSKDDDFWINNSILGKYDKKFTEYYTLLDYFGVNKEIQSGFIYFHHNGISVIEYDDDLYLEIFSKYVELPDELSKIREHLEIQFKNIYQQVLKDRTLFQRLFEKSEKTQIRFLKEKQKYWESFSPTLNSPLGRLYLSKAEKVLKYAKDKPTHSIFPHLVEHIKIFIKQHFDELERIENERLRKEGKEPPRIFYSRSKPTNEEGLAEWIKGINAKIQEIEDPVFLLKAMVELTKLAKIKTVELSLADDYLNISDDFKIRIKAFDNMEIPMSDLTKSVYLLFYNHPKGINIKLLNDYKEELLGIYTKISGLSDYDKMQKNIDKLCDINTNEIYVHISRIKKSFEDKMESYFANQFIIGSERHGNPVKYIKAIYKKED